ncbi:MAG: hypothetical protein QM742_00245 [Aquabacterium sp.]
MHAPVPSSRALLAALALAGLLTGGSAQALQFTLSDQSADTWTYTLTYDPLDNYAVHGAPESATIRLTGLAGVTQATGPTSTDYTEAFLDQLNRNWTAQILNGGTEVLWTHLGPGTGNFNEAKHVFGFSVVAPGMASGAARVSTTGFTTDVDRGYQPIDIDVAVAAPVPEPQGWALMMAGVVVVGSMWRRVRKAH